MYLFEFKLDDNTSVGMHYISSCFPPNHGSYPSLFALNLKKVAFLVCFGIFFLSALKNDLLLYLKGDTVLGNLLLPKRT